jgi:hypothetical protein
VVVLSEADAVAIKVVPITSNRTILLNPMAATIHNTLKAHRITKDLRNRVRPLSTTVLMGSRILHHT